jgi:alkaline phosphatase D
MRLTRRTLIKAAGITIVSALGCGTREDPNDLDPTDLDPTDPDPEDRDPEPSDADLPPDLRLFPFGIACGDVLSTRALLWTRYLGAGPLWLRISAVGANAESPLVDAEVSVGPDGFTHVDVGDLEPGRRYDYRFVIKSSDGKTIARSEGGRFRTPIDGDRVEPLVFGVSSCSHQRAVPFPVLEQAATQELDLFFHLGDHVYNDGVTTLEALRAEYAINWSASGMRALRRSCAWYDTWDDHEYTNNWDLEWADPATLELVRRAWFEHIPMRRDAEDPNRLWRSVRWGATAEFFVLDLRSERKPSTRLTEQAEYVSRAQMQWLREGLLASNALFKFVLTPVPISTIPIEVDGAVQDRWEGWTAQRREILSWIRDRAISGVWWLAGDFHLGSAGHLDPPGYLYYGWREVLTGAAGNHGWEGYQHMVDRPQWSFATDANNFVRFEIDPIAATMHLAFIGPAGEVLFEESHAAEWAPASLAAAGIIGEKYEMLGGAGGLLGPVLTEEDATYDGTGRWQQFKRGYIFWHPDTGAFEIHGPILDRWAELGWSQSELGYPLSDVYDVPEGMESRFQNGRLRWDASSGAVSLLAA